MGVRGLRREPTLSVFRAVGVVLESDGTQTVTGTIVSKFRTAMGSVKKGAYENNSLVEETIFFYDAGGKLIGEFSKIIAAPPPGCHGRVPRQRSPRV
jgi:hypothetical protein